MKLISKLIFIYLFLFITSYVPPYLNHLSSSSFHNFFKEYEINNNQNQAVKTNITDKLVNAITYLPASYFSLIIKEIVPQSSNFTQFLKGSYCLSNYLTEKNVTKANFLVKYSAKSFPDYGDEEGCLSHKNNAFILFTIKYNYHNSKGYSGQFKLLPFISNGFSFYGLCVENNINCTTNLVENIKGLINNKTGALNGIENLTMTTFIHYPKESNENKNFDKTSFFIIYLIFGVYILIRVTIWIIGSYFFIEKDEINSKKKGNDDSSSSSSSDEEEEDDETNTRTKEKEKEKDKEKNEEKPNNLIEKQEKKTSNKKKYPKFYFFYEICSFAKGFKILYQKYNNSCYTEADLYFIIFFRFIALIFKVLYSNLNFIIYNPSKEINNTELFNLTLTFVLKFSSFTDVIIVITEGIILSYKLMTFIRKYTEKTEQPSFKLFLNFFLRIIPSVIAVLLIFICFYLSNNSLIAALHLNNREDEIYNTRIQHMNENLMNCYSCTKSWKNLIPFYMHYSNYNEQDSLNGNCFHFMIIMVNLFYCYCICILLTYVVFKLKSKIFDIIITIIFLVNLLLPNNISCNSFLDEHNYFNIRLLLGETCSLTYTHLFINYYFFGFLIGIALFYNNDITNPHSLQNSEIYKPFYYLKDLIGFLFRCATWIHALIILITFGIPFLLFFSFLIYTRNNINYEDLQILNGFDKFLYLNEKTVFAIAFGFFLLHLYVYKFESKIKEFGNDIVVISFCRIGYEFYSIIEIIINTMYSSFSLNFNLSMNNLFYFSYGIAFFIYMTSLVLFVSTQLPIKIITKKILKLEKKV